MESLSTEREIYVSKPQDLDPEKVSKVLGGWKIISWVDEGYRFESPSVLGLPEMVMVITDKEFYLQPIKWREADPRIFLRKVRKIEIRERQMVISTNDGDCYVWLQGLKARIFYGKRINGKQAAISVSFGNPNK